MVEVAKLYFWNTLDEKVYNASQDRWPKLHCPTSSHVKIPVSCWRLHCWCECLLCWVDLSSSFLAFCTLRIGPCRMAQTTKKRKTSCCTDLAMTMVLRLEREKVQLFKFWISEWKHAPLSCSSLAVKNVKRFIRHTQRDSTKKWITLQTEVFGYNIIELFGCSLLKKTTQDPELWLLLFSRATIFVHHMFPARVPSGLQHLIVKLAWQTCKVQLVSNM